MDNGDGMYISAAGILTDTRILDNQLVAAAVELMVSGVSFRNTPSFATLRANGLRRVHQRRRGWKDEDDELSPRWRNQADQKPGWMEDWG
jgi:hypothetical protein